MSEFVWICGFAGLLLGLIAAVATRREPWVVRVLGCAAVAVAWFAASDRQREAVERVPPHVVAVTTGDARLDELAARVGRIEGARFDAVGGLRVPLGIAAARARWGVEGVDRVVVWNAPIAAVDGRHEHGVATYTTVEQAPIEPADLEVRTLAPLRVGRPGAFELRATRALPPRVTVRFEARDPEGAVVASRELGADELTRPVTVEFDPPRPGALEVVCSARLDATTASLRGEVAVGAAPGVGVFGAQRAVVIAALRAQGIDAVPFEIGDAPESVGVIVATERIPLELQERLAEFVDVGGGLFVVGAPDGGALPAADQPLHAWMPVEVLSLPEVPDANSGGGGEGGPPETEPDPDPQPTQPEPDPPMPDPPQPDPPIGDVDNTDPTIDSEPAEVERKQVALLLVIDQSASMGAEITPDATRMDFAKRSAFETAAALEPDDLLGIVSFDSTYHDVLTMGPVPDRGRLRQEIEKLRAIGGDTRPQFGLQRARELLRDVDVGVKHVILLTDGDAIADADLARSARIAQQLAAAGATVSLVHVVGPNDGSVELRFIAAIARSGKGQFHHTRDATQIPRIVLTEVRKVLGGAGRGDNANPNPPPRNPDPEPPQPDPDPTPEPEPEPEPEPDPPEPEPDPDPDPDPSPPTLTVRAVADSPLCAPEPPSGYARLHAIADVAGRPDAFTLFVAGDRGVPLLSFANRGLGRVGAWTADFHAHGRAWPESDDFPARLAQWVSYLLPAQPDTGPRDVRDAIELTPVAPTRAEIEFLRAGSGGEIATLAQYAPPPVATRTTRNGRAIDDALLALAAAVALAIVEFVARRM